MDEYSGWISWLMTLQARCQGAKQTTTQVFAGKRAPGLQRTPTYVQTESQHRIQDSGISIEQTTCSHLHLSPLVSSNDRPANANHFTFVHDRGRPSHLICHVLMCLSSVMHSAAVTHQQPSTSLQQRHDIYFVLVLEQ